MQGNSKWLELNMESLEPRLMLNGDFFLSETRLTLDNFDEGEALSLSENDTAFLFFLDNGDWQGTDGPGITGSQTSMLSVEKDVVHSLLGGIKIHDSNETDMSVGIGSVDYSQLPDTFRIVSVGHVEQSAGSNVTFAHLSINGQSVEFAKNAADTFDVNNKLSLILEFDADIGDEGSANSATAAITSQQGNIFYNEKSDTHLHHINGQMVDIRSGGTISGTPSAQIVADELKLQADNRIYLGNSAGTSINVSGSAELYADTAILLNGHGTSYFGQLNFMTDGYARINESDSTELFSVNNAQMLHFFSGGDITQYANGAAQEIRVDNYAKFLAKGDISLANEAGQLAWFTATARFIGANHLTVGVGGTAHMERLSFDITGVATVNVQRHIRFTGANFAANGTFISADIIGATDNSYVRIYGDATFIAIKNIGLGLRENQDFIIDGLASFRTERAILINGVGHNHIPKLNFNSGSTTIIMLNSSVRLFGENTARGLLLRSTGSVWDAPGATLTTENDLSIHAEGNVFVADDESNRIETEGSGRISGNAITFNDAGTVNFAEIGLYSDGFLYFSEDSSTHLLSRNMAESAVFKSPGNFTDEPNADITVEHNLMITAQRIYLGDDTDNTISVGGLATFEATVAVQISAAADVHFGRLNFNSPGYVNISEDGNMHLNGNLIANDAILYSSGSITDQGNVSFSAARNASFKASVGIYLADESSDRYRVCNYAEFNAPEFVIVGRMGDVDLADAFVFPTAYEELTFDEVEC